MRLFLFGLVTFILGFYGQLFILTVVGPDTAAPHLLFLLTIATGLFHGPVLAETLGFFWGLSADSLSTTYFGVQGLLLTSIGFLSGFANRYIQRDQAISQMVLSGIFSLAYIFILMLMSWGFSGGFKVQWSKLFIMGVWNIVLAPFILSGYVLWMKLWGKKKSV